MSDYPCKGWHTMFKVSFRMDLYKRFWRQDNIQEFQQNQFAFYNQPSFLQNMEQRISIKSVVILAPMPLEICIVRLMQDNKMTLSLWLVMDQTQVAYAFWQLFATQEALNRILFSACFKAQEMCLCLVVIEKLEAIISQCVAANAGPFLGTFLLCWCKGSF